MDLNLLDEHFVFSVCAEESLLCGNYRNSNINLENNNVKRWRTGNERKNRKNQQNFDGKATPTTNRWLNISILWMCICFTLSTEFFLFFFFSSSPRICLHIIRWAHLWLIIIVAVVAPRNRKVNYDKFLSQNHLEKSVC